MIKITQFTLILLISITLLSGCIFPKELKPDGSVTDQTTIQTINYDNYANFFQTSSKSKLHEVTTEITYENHNLPNQYLRNCGGIKPVGYILADENDVSIATQADLLSRIGMIKTPEEAVAWLYATSCNLNNTFASKTQFVNQNDEGFFVHTIFYNWYGCGNHAHRLNKYFVSYFGKVELIESVKLEFGQEFCGD